ncbi:carbohydrate ABC transporter permease [Allostreptomyces psammosilenae]|uniref:Raffinose/stachyose/melibiose transport system permease protein n=1 Tax=Allostreptomyces psammosilenae TaxID=1892865 RepID=A0A852ZQF8_9ACTN|nr:sugar ABC transporter permease [Allostreptomyces psammosilenae]NYI03476.1 raffinose/stachyose/melibiose transport system permease protein [Allostreptomyces psammosilenae]NYI03727.1 raffinose/stachyose/melibiose transport system permease protein [Allostreptomyces psammosilenae]
MPRSRVFYWMAAPAVILFFVLHTLPALQGAFYSLTNFSGYGDWEFVGLRNYAAMTRDDRILDSYLFTLGFAIAATIATNVIALAIAVGLNSRIWFRKTLRAIFFLPNVLSVLIVGFVFNYFFAFILPQWGASWGIDRLAVNILGDPDLAWIGVVIVTVWQAVAFNIIIYLAGLQTIGADIYEAAAIDGATPWQRFRRITFPLIAPFFTINMVLALRGFLQVFDQIMALTGGGPGNATQSISVLIFQGGFQGGEFAYQSANAVIYFLLIAGLSLLQLRVLQRREVNA